MDWRNLAAVLSGGMSLGLYVNVSGPDFPRATSASNLVSKRKSDKVSLRCKFSDNLFKIEFDPCGEH